jgi:hypothetical protein
MKIKKIPLKELIQVIALENKIGDHFKKITGLEAHEVKFLYTLEEFQTDCDGDDNQIYVEITNEQKPEYGEVNTFKQVDLLKLHKDLCNFEMMPQVKQEIWGFDIQPTIKTICTFCYYNFTKR